MSKSPTSKKTVPVEENSEDAGKKKRKFARSMLTFAALIAAASMGGGIYLARYALKKDAAAVDPAQTTKTEQKGTAEQTGSVGGKGAKAEKKTESGAKNDPKSDGLLEFKDFTTNLTSVDANGGARKSYMKLTIAMVYKAAPEAKTLMVERQPFMRDLFNTYIRSLSEADLRGGIGILTLKSELLKRARAAAGNELPQEILIQDLIVN